MSTRVLLKESELVSMIKKIIKESKFSYSDFDYMSAFFQIFHNWLKKNTPEEVWSYPTSYLIQKYSKPFLQSLGGDNARWESDDYEINKWDVQRIVDAAVKQGQYKLPSLYKEEKFTEKYKKIIPTLIEHLELPEYSQIEIIEDDPNFVKFKPQVLYANMLLADETKRVDRYNLDRKITHFLENFIGLELGNPVHGKVEISVTDPVLFGIDEWIKDVLNKQIKKHIRAFPEARGLKSIRFQPNVTGGEMKLVFTGYPSFALRNALRDKIKSYLQQLGYGQKIKIDI